MTKQLLAVCTIGILALGAAACGSSSSPVAPAPIANVPTESIGESSLDAKPGQAAGAKPGSLTIVGLVLQADGEFDVLQAAVVRAGLVEALNGTKQ